MSSVKKEERLKRSIGTRVAVQDVGEGVLRYVGKVGTKGEKRCGVELDTPVGKSDGTFAKKRYFDCESNHAIFVTLDKIKVLDKAAARASASAGLSPIVTRKSIKSATKSTVSPAGRSSTSHGGGIKKTAARKSIKPAKKTTTTAPTAKKVPVLRSKSRPQEVQDVESADGGSVHDEDEDAELSDDDEVQRRISELQADAALERRRAELLADANRRASVSGSRPSPLAAPLAPDQPQGSGESGDAHEESEEDMGEVEERLQQLQIEAALRRQARENEKVQREQEIVPSVDTNSALEPSESAEFANSGDGNHDSTRSSETETDEEPPSAAIQESGEGDAQTYSPPPHELGESVIAAQVPPSVDPLVDGEDPEEIAKEGESPHNKRSSTELWNAVKKASLSSTPPKPSALEDVVDTARIVHMLQEEQYDRVSGTIAHEDGALEREEKVVDEVPDRDGEGSLAKQATNGHSSQICSADLHQRVHVQNIGTGYLRFIGEIHLGKSAERWLGVELDLPKGKNDGSIPRNIDGSETAQAVRYFSCRSNHGIFATVSSQTVTLAEDDSDTSDDDSGVDDLISAQWDRARAQQAAAVEERRRKEEDARAERELAEVRRREEEEQRQREEHEARQRELALKAAKEQASNAFEARKARESNRKIALEKARQEAREQLEVSIAGKVLGSISPPVQDEEDTPPSPASARAQNFFASIGNESGTATKLSPLSSSESPRTSLHEPVTPGTSKLTNDAADFFSSLAQRTSEMTITEELEPKSPQIAALPEVGVPGPDFDDTGDLTSSDESMDVDGEDATSGIDEASTQPEAPSGYRSGRASVDSDLDVDGEDEVAITDDLNKIPEDSELGHVGSGISNLPDSHNEEPCRSDEDAMVQPESEDHTPIVTESQDAQSEAGGSDSNVQPVIADMSALDTASDVDFQQGVIMGEKAVSVETLGAPSPEDGVDNLDASPTVAEDQGSSVDPDAAEQIESLESDPTAELSSSSEEEIDVGPQNEVPIEGFVPETEISSEASEHDTKRTHTTEMTSSGQEISDVELIDRSQVVSDTQRGPLEPDNLDAISALAASAAAELSSSDDESDVDAEQSEVPIAEVSSETVQLEVDEHALDAASCDREVADEDMETESRVSTGNSQKKSLEPDSDEFLSTNTKVLTEPSPSHIDFDTGPGQDTTSEDVEPQNHPIEDTIADESSAQPLVDPSAGVDEGPKESSNTGATMSSTVRPTADADVAAELSSSDDESDDNDQQGVPSDVEHVDSAKTAAIDKTEDLQTPSLGSMDENMDNVVPQASVPESALSVQPASADSVSDGTTSLPIADSSEEESELTLNGAISCEIESQEDPVVNSPTQETNEVNDIPTLSSASSSSPTDLVENALHTTLVKEDGVKLGFSVNVVDEIVIVTKSTPGSPASNGGIEVGMQLVEINGVQCIGLTRNSVLEIIKEAESLLHMTFHRIAQPQPESPNPDVSGAAHERETVQSTTEAADSTMGVKSTDEKMGAHDEGDGAEKQDKESAFDGDAETRKYSSIELESMLSQLSSDDDDESGDESEEEPVATEEAMSDRYAEKQTAITKSTHMNTNGLSHAPTTETGLANEPTNEGTSDVQDASATMDASVSDAYSSSEEEDDDDNEDTAELSVPAEQDSHPDTTLRKEDDDDDEEKEENEEEASDTQSQIRPAHVPIEVAPEMVADETTTEHRPSEPLSPTFRMPPPPPEPAPLDNGCPEETLDSPAESPAVPSPDTSEQPAVASASAPAPASPGRARRRRGLLGRLSSVKKSNKDSTKQQPAPAAVVPPPSTTPDGGEVDEATSPTSPEFVDRDLLASLIAGCDPTDAPGTTASSGAPVKPVLHATGSAPKAAWYSQVLSAKVVKPDKSDKQFEGNCRDVFIQALRQSTYPTGGFMCDVKHEMSLDGSPAKNRAWKTNVFIEQRGCVLLVCKKKGNPQLVEPRALVLATAHSVAPVDNPKWKDRAVRVRSFNAGTFLLRPLTVAVPDLLKSLQVPVVSMLDSTHYDNPEEEAVRVAIAARKDTVKLASGHELVQVLVLGLSGSGKSSLLASIQGERFEPARQSSSNPVSVVLPWCANIAYACTEVPGTQSPQWPLHYLPAGGKPAPYGIIFVIDSTDPVAMVEAKRELDMLLNCQQLRDTIIVIVANKHGDSERGSLDANQIIETLKIPRVGHQVGLVTVNARGGQGVAAPFLFLDAARPHAWAGK